MSFPPRVRDRLLAPTAGYNWYAKGHDRLGGLQSCSSNTAQRTIWPSHREASGKLARGVFGPGACRVRPSLAVFITP